MRLALALVFLLSGLASAQVELPLKMSPGVDASVNSPLSPPSVASPQGGQAYQVFHLEFQDEASARAFAATRSTGFNSFGRFVDVYVEPTREALQELASAPGLKWADSAGRVELPPSVELQEVPARSVTEEIVRGGLEGLTGKGVVLAIIDTGVDIHHPDFVALDESGQPVSRFEYFWDTQGSLNPNGMKAPVSYPGGQSVGTVYSRDQLTAALRGKVQLPALDVQGHGTACASIAGGNGRALGGQHIGVAPEATLIGVRIGGRNVENNYLIGAVLGWLEQVAGTRPLVASNSWGGQFHGHDGARVIDRQLDARYPADRAGRLVLFAAGNSGADPLHGSAAYAGSDRPGVLEWNAGSGATMLVYFDNADQGLVATPALKRSDYVHPLTGQRVWEVELPPGAGQLSIHSASGAAGKVDAYVFGGDFRGQCLTYSTLVGSPGTTGNVLTVGSYDFNSLFHHRGKAVVVGVGPEMKAPMQVGELSYYSSPGYTRTGAIKPDVAAPGQWFSAAAPLDPAVQVIRDTSGKYRLFNGTSAATPYVAGVCALLMEQNPQLSLAQFRAMLDAHATNDFSTGKVPNPRWGRGKLDLAAIKAMVSASRR